jgi:hypothetical protein
MTSTIDHHRRLLGITPRRHPKRGVLLLVVLSLLTLFMLLGTTYMVVTSRARSTARAFSRAAEAAHSPQSAAGRRFVDEAFLAVARGPATSEDANRNGVLDNGEDQNGDGKLDFVGYPIGEDLLGDKYGFASRKATLSSRKVLIGKLDPPSDVAGVSGQTQQNPTLVFVPVRSWKYGSANPEQLAGRVVTFTLPDFTWSTRILRAEGTPGQPSTGFVVSLIPVAGCRGATLADLRDAINRATNAASTDFVVNTREFVGDPTGGAATDTNEPYDGFDAANPFLAQIVPSPAYSPASPSTNLGSPSATSVRASYAPPAGGGTPVVDNDSDGVFDSYWLDFGFPVIRDSSGVACKPRVAVLVVDLDGRLNVNAHGSLTAALALQNATDLEWPTAATTQLPGLTAVQFKALPLGSGYGPPEVRLGDLFQVGNDPKVAGTALNQLLSGTTLTFDARNPQQRYSGAKRPLVSATNAWGRYGDSGVNPRPGDSGIDDAVSVIQDQQQARTSDGKGSVRDRSLCNDWLQRSQTGPNAFASPSDLSGRMKVFADRSPKDSTPQRNDIPGVVSRLVYAKPVVAGARWWQGDTTDDPYEVRLDRRVAGDSTFGADELERVLRIYDWDAAQLPSRLAALLGRDAERLRLLLSTESWDTTAIVGPAWQKIEDALALARTPPGVWTEVFAPELIGGRKLDINRPVQSALEKQMLCRQLYTLLWALTGSSDTKAMAQWAVNVVDFRDADSAMTRFVYDRNPADGWMPDPNDAVWGAERPELLINEALAWKSDSGLHGGVYISLHHPWSSKALDGDQLAPAGAKPETSSSTDPDAVDPALDATTPKNVLNLDARGGNDNDSPIWRLRVANKIVRLDAPPNDQAKGAEYWSKPANNNPSANREVPPDGSFCVYGESKAPAGGAVDVTTAFPAAAQLKIDMQGSSAASLTPGNAATITIILERLADPTQMYDPTTNDYLEIDRVESVAVVDRTPNPVTNQPLEGYAKQYRKVDSSTPGTFWKRVFDLAQKLPADPISVDKPTASPRVACMPWLNRPYISAAELALVPPWDSATLLDQYSGFTGNGMLDVLAGELFPPPATPEQKAVFLTNLLETVTVPSRFSGLATTVDEYPTGGNPFAGAANPGRDPGLDKLPINQLSGYREPGRVNLNTASDQRVWEAAVLRGPRPSGTAAVSNTALEWSTSTLGRPAGPSQATTAPPAASTFQLLGLKGGATVPTMVADTADPGPDPAGNPQFQYLTATRLANVATPRSNVFAVWVTVGFFQWDETAKTFILDTNGNPVEVGADTGDVQRHRGFFIFDRSIPVAYETGFDHNVRDAILLRRIIQ